MKKLNVSILLTVLFVAVVLLLAPLFTHAQAQVNLPGNGCDPYDGCPAKVSNWVIIFGFVSLICLMYHTGKK